MDARATTTERGQTTTAKLPRTPDDSRPGRLEPLQHQEFRRLWTASLVSELGDAVGRVALTILVQRETGSAILTGSVVAMYSLPYLGPGQWITAKVARLPRRRVLVIADVLRAVCFAAMVLPIGIYPRLALLALASLATPPFHAVSGALVARSVPDRLLDTAAGLRTATTELAFVVGFAIGGLVADLASPSAVIGFDALTFLVSAALVARIPAGAEPPEGSSHPVRFGDGSRAILRDPSCRRALILTSTAFALVLVPETLVATYADETFPGTNGLTGALAAVTAVGVIGATLLRRPDNDEAALRHAAAIVVAGGSVAAVAFALTDQIALAVIGYLAVGPVLAIRVHQYSILSRRIPDVLLAPAISVAGGAISISYLVAGLGGGAVAEWIGVDNAATGAAALAVAVGAASLLVPPKKVSSPRG